MYPLLLMGLELVPAHSSRHTSLICLHSAMSVTLLSYSFHSTFRVSKRSMTDYLQKRGRFCVWNYHCGSELPHNASLLLPLPFQPPDTPHFLKKVTVQQSATSFQTTVVSESRVLTLSLFHVPVQPYFNDIQFYS